MRDLRISQKIQRSGEIEPIREGGGKSRFLSFDSGRDGHCSMCPRRI